MARRASLLLILLAGTALRLFRLGADSLWYDETVSVYLAGSPAGELLRHTAGDIHPPGYYVLLRGWLIATGFGDGRAGAQGHVLEFMAAFFSLFFGVLLIALVCTAARRLAGRGTGLVAGALVALSPFNVWYSQEVRMYTLAAAVGVVALGSLALAVSSGRRQENAAASRRAWLVYAIAAAVGMYVVYYFAFLLLPAVVWAIAYTRRTRRALGPLLLANLGAVALYAPWLPIAWRQATDPPVPPWRTTPNAWHALVESWTALSLGQSAPRWLWPVLVATALLVAVGLIRLARSAGNDDARPVGPGPAAGVAAAAFGPLALILGLSTVTPLYHVRYLFTYSPTLYVLLAAGLVAVARRWRPLAAVFALLWVLAAGVTLRAFWGNAVFRADDHRAAVADLREAWRPGDAVLVNAGWAYTALMTYWNGDVAGRYRITGTLPETRDDDALVIVTTGHVDGDPGLGWGDPRSDFFAMPSTAARQQVADLFRRFPRVWHYRIYDTVNDPGGLVRELLAQDGRLVEDRVYGGEAFLRLQAYARPDQSWPVALPRAEFGDLEVTWQRADTRVEAGGRLYADVWWRADKPLTTLLATSLRLVGPDGGTWAQPPDANPLLPMHTSVEWLPGDVQRQVAAVSVPLGVVPGVYDWVLLPYESGSGRPLPITGTGAGARLAASGGLLLGQVEVHRPDPAPSRQRALAQFGPLALVAAESAAVTLSPGDTLTAELVWQAREAPELGYVVVVQLVDRSGRVAANAEAEPVGGRYPTTVWTRGEVVRDVHRLGLPPDMAPGNYRLIVGVYRAADRQRLTTRSGLLSTTDHWQIKAITVR